MAVSSPLIKAGDPITDPFATPKSRSDRERMLQPEAQPPPPRIQTRFVEAWRAPLGSPLSGPLLPLAELTLASVESGSIQALSVAEGRVAWKTDLGEPLAGGPVSFAGQAVQAAVSGRITALDPSGGARRWTLDLRGEIARPLTPTGDRLLVPLATGHLVALDGEGKERWRVGLRAAPSSPACACRGFAVVGTEAGTVEAFDRETGRRLWIHDAGAAVRSPLLCHRGLIYFGTADYRFSAIRASGRRKWSYRVGGDIAAVPFADERRIYFLCYDNYLYVLKARSGHLLLKVRLSHRLGDDALWAADRLYLSPYTSARLVTLSLPELQLVGEYRLDVEGEWFTTPPVLAGERVLIGYGRYEGRILALKEEKAPAEKEPPAAPS